MGEYLARAVQKATGTHQRSLVMPNHRPVFPPAHSEATPPSLRLSTANVNLGHEIPVSASTQFQISSTLGQTASKVIPKQPTQQLMRQAAVQNAIAAVVRAIETPTQRAGTVAPSAPEALTVAASELETRNRQREGVAPKESVLREIISQDNESPRKAPQLQVRESAAERNAIEEPRERVLREITSQNNESPGNVPQFDVRESVAVARRNAALHGEPPSTSEEPASLQVHIGRVEVRVAAPVPATVPPSAKPQAPRGFAEYEAVRRYQTRSRV